MLDATVDATEAKASHGTMCEHGDGHQHGLWIWMGRAREI